MQTHHLQVELSTAGGHQQGVESSKSVAIGSCNDWRHLCHALPAGQRGCKAGHGMRVLRRREAPPRNLQA